MRTVLVNLYDSTKYLAVQKKDSTNFCNTKLGYYYSMLQSKKHDLCIRYWLGKGGSFFNAVKRLRHTMQRPCMIG